MNSTTQTISPFGQRLLTTCGCANSPPSPRAVNHQFALFRWLITCERGKLFHASTARRSISDSSMPFRTFTSGPLNLQFTSLCCM